MQQYTSANHKNKIIQCDHSRQCNLMVARPTDFSTVYFLYPRIHQLQLFRPKICTEARPPE